MSFLTTQCPPPSSCAMSSLLLLPHRTAEAAEAYGARTGLCSGLWRQKIPPPSACQFSRLAQLMPNAPPHPQQKPLFTYGSFSVGKHKIPSCPLSSFSPLGPSLPQQILRQFGGLSFSPSILSPLDNITEPQSVTRPGTEPCLHFTDEKGKAREAHCLGQDPTVLRWFHTSLRRDKAREDDRERQGE